MEAAALIFEVLGNCLDETLTPALDTGLASLWDMQFGPRWWYINKDLLSWGWWACLCISAAYIEDLVAAVALRNQVHNNNI